MSVPLFGQHAAGSAVSPAELLKSFITDMRDPAIVPAGAVVGGANDDQQQAGVVQLMDAGNDQIDKSGYLLFKRIQVRCIGGTLDAADRIGNHCFELLDDQERVEIEDADGRTWLVHGISVSAGTSHHIDSKETWESLLYARMTIGRQPVRSA